MSRRTDLQADYIAELRALQPGLLRWWMALGGLATPSDSPPPEVQARWPFGISGHPRVIEVFRRYFLELDRLNQEETEARGEADRRDLGDEGAWGEEDPGHPFGFVRPQDLLIFTIPRIAPDLAKLAAGIVFVPVGQNQYDESV